MADAIIVQTVRFQISAVKIQTIGITITTNCSDIITPIATIKTYIYNHEITTNNINIIDIPIMTNNNYISNLSINTNSAIIVTPRFLNLKNEFLEVISIESGSPEYLQTTRLFEENILQSASNGIKIEVTIAENDITDYGITWGEHENPTLADNVVSYGVPATGVITIEYFNTNLSDKIYYARPYTIKNNIITYGNNIIFGVIFVYTANDLNNVRNNLSANYKQMANIDLSDYSSWLPIGTTDDNFYGIYDGNGFSINGLKIDNGGFYSSLFGLVLSTEYSIATLKNIKLLNANMNVYGGKTGVLVGYIEGVVDNCHADGNIISSYNYCGGLIGSCMNSNIINSSANVVLNDAPSIDRGGGYGFGGLIGSCALTTINKCFALGNINGVHLKEKSYNSTQAVGGLIGMDGNGNTITNSFATGKVIGGLYNIGGFIGYIDSPETTVENCYTISPLIAYGDDEDSKVGAFIGTKDSPAIITSCYYNSDISEFLDEKGIPKTTAEMKTQETYIGWDFVNIWGISADKNNGYPCFDFDTIKNIIIYTKSFYL